VLKSQQLAMGAPDDGGPRYGNNGTMVNPTGTGADSTEREKSTYFCWTVGVWSMWGSNGAHLEPLVSFCSASREMTWPQTRRTGGLLSVLCWRRMGHANIEWNRHSGPRSISIYAQITQSAAPHPRQPKHTAVQQSSMLKSRRQQRSWQTYHAQKS